MPINKTTKTGTMPIIPANKRPYQVIPQILGSSPYLAPPVQLTKIHGVPRNGKSNKNSTIFATGLVVSNCNPFHLKPDMVFGQQEERNAERRRQSRALRSTLNDLPDNKNGSSNGQRGNKSGKPLQNDRQNNNQSNKARMILLPCEVDSLMEEFGIGDDTTTISKRFGTVNIIPDDESVGSDCLEAFGDDIREDTEMEKKIEQEGPSPGDIKKEIAATDTSYVSLPEVSSSIQSGKSNGSSRGKQTNQVLNSDISMLVLPKIQQSFGTTQNDMDDFEKSDINLANDTQHTFVTGVNSGVKEKHENLYEEDSCNEGIDPDSFESDDDATHEIRYPTQEYCSDQNEEDYDDERVFQQMQRSKSRISHS